MEVIRLKNTGLKKAGTGEISKRLRCLCSGENGEDYILRLVAEEIPMPWNWPAEVNYLEAKAFANWKTKTTGKIHRLPTEAEWYRLHEAAGLKDVTDWQKAPETSTWSIALHPVRWINLSKEILHFSGQRVAI